MKPEALVSAPTLQLYKHWLRVTGKSPSLYPYINDFRVMHGYWGPVIVLNGGNRDAHIMSMLHHPTRAGTLTYLEV